MSQSVRLSTVLGSTFCYSREMTSLREGLSGGREDMVVGLVCSDWYYI